MNAPATRVLVVEDNPINRDLLEYLLRALGFDALSAVDGLAGLAAAQRERPELILCDIHMPGIDGIEFARRIKADPATAATPLVAVTALAMVGDRDRILDAGFDGYIAKPIDPTRFLDELRPFLARQPVQRTPPHPAPQAPGGGLLLVVENEPINLEFKRTLLEQVGFTVIEAVDADGALSLARARRPRLIVSDVELGGRSGLDLLRAVKADPQLRDTPVLLVTTSRWDDALRDEALRDGACGYLRRPMEPQRIVDEIRRALERPTER
jgi:two-component system cell cycle response regulator